MLANTVHINSQGDDKTYVGRSVELEVLVQTRNLLNLTVLEIKAGNIQVLRQAVWRVGLGDNAETALGGPAEKNLGGSLAVSLCNLLDDGVVEKKRGVGSDLHVALEEALGAERRVGGDLDVVLAGELNEVGLDVVRVVFDLKGSGLDLGVGEEVEEEGTAVVAYTNALCEALALDVLKGFPCAL